MEFPECSVRICDVADSRKCAACSYIPVLKGRLCITCKQTYLPKVVVDKIHLKDSIVKKFVKPTSYNCQEVESSQLGKDVSRRMQQQQNFCNIKGLSVKVPKIYPCNLCSITFQEESQLHTHQTECKTDLDNSQFTCDICGRMFRHVGPNYQKKFILGCISHQKF